MPDDSLRAPSPTGQGKDMLATTPPGMRRMRSFGFVAGVALLLSVSAVAPAVASPDTDELAGQAATNQIPGVDEIVSSPNLRQIANVPKQGPFADATNSDIAFQGHFAYAGNYNGFMIFDISNPRRPSAVSQVLCPGSQNDISVLGDLLFLSTDSSRSDDSCASTTAPASEQASWEGIKIFDISD